MKSGDENDGHIFQVVLGKISKQVFEQVLRIGYQGMSTTNY